MYFETKNLELNINNKKYKGLRDIDKFLNYCIPYFERYHFNSFCKKTIDASNDIIEYVNLTLSVRIERKETTTVAYKMFENLYKEYLNRTMSLMSDKIEKSST